VNLMSEQEDLIELRAQQKLLEKKFDVLLKILEEEGIVRKSDIDEQI